MLDMQQNVKNEFKRRKKNIFNNNFFPQYMSRCCSVNAHKIKGLMCFESASFFFKKKNRKIKLCS